MNGGGGLQQQLTAEAVPIFKECIRLLFSIWTALQFAVDNESGGPDSRRITDKLIADVFTWFTQSKKEHYVWDLEKLLDDTICNDLNTDVDDGTIKKTAEKLISMYGECLEGNYTSLETVRSEVIRRARAVPHIIQAAAADDDDTDEDDDDDEAGMEANINDSSNMLVDEPDGPDFAIVRNQ